MDLHDHEKHKLLLAFPGRDEGPRKRFNISKIYEQKFNLLIEKAYKKVDIYDNDNEDDPID